MDFEPGVLRILDRQTDPMVLPVPRSGEAQRVFFTDLLGDSDTNLVHVGHLARQKYFASGLLRDSRKNLRIAVSVVLVEYSDRIDDDAIFTHGVQRFGQRRMTRVVSAIG